MVQLRWTMKRWIPIALMLATAACGDASTEIGEGDDIDWMMSHTESYLEDADWRREKLESSLWRPELPYARKRLAAYALKEEGWDLLPVIKTEVEGVEAFEADEFNGSAFFDGETPQTRDEWLALGKTVFYEMPMRRDAYLDWVADRPELWQEVGLQTKENGELRGVVKFKDMRGRTRKAATCAMCHANDGVEGFAAKGLDLGMGRALFADATGTDPQSFADWGAGTVDVTDDGVTDSLAIPNLWGVSEQAYINKSGAIKLTSPAALAVRFETQYIVGHSLEGRPDRRLTWALAMYVLSLQAPEPAEEGPVAEGAEIFEQNCATCHNPESGFSGGLVPAELLTSDPQAAYSSFRGTGFYKTPSLLGVSQGGPYLHDASVDSLDTLLREGHPTGDKLDDEERAQLLDFLETL